MFVTTYKQWNEWAEHYTMLPYVQSFPLENDRILSWEYAWKEANPGSFVLESGKGGRYTFLGLQPISEIRGNTITRSLRIQMDLSLNCMGLHWSWFIDG